MSAAAAAQTADAESEALNHALEEAGASPVDFIRALENHLQKYPNTARAVRKSSAAWCAARRMRRTSRVVA